MRVEELAAKIGTSVPTISAWYRWKKQNPEHELAKLLPCFVRKGPHGTKYWYESDIPRLMEFKNSIPQGRNGVMGSVTQKYVKKNRITKEVINSNEIIIRRKQQWQTILSTL